MLEGIIDVALKQRLLVFIGAIALAAWGVSSYLKLPIDAFPDVAPVQVLVSMRAPGLTPEELESRVTAPIEIAMRGIPNLVQMRSTTRYAVSLMTFEFADGTDIFWARAQVNERLQDIRDQLPPGADGGLAPVVTALAEVLMFTIEFRATQRPGGAQPGRLDDPPGRARTAGRSRCERAWRLRAHLRGGAVGAGNGGARYHDRDAGDSARRQ